MVILTANAPAQSSSAKPAEHYSDVPICSTTAHRVVEFRRSMSSHRRPDLRVDLHWAGDEDRLAAPNSSGEIEAERKPRPDPARAEGSVPPVSPDDWFDAPGIEELHRSITFLTEWMQRLEKSCVEWLQGLESDIAGLQKDISSLSNQVHQVRDAPRRFTDLLGHDADKLQVKQQANVGANEINGADLKRSDNGNGDGQAPDTSEAGMIEQDPARNT